MSSTSPPSNAHTHGSNQRDDFDGSSLRILTMDNTFIVVFELRLMRAGNIDKAISLSDTRISKSILICERTSRSLFIRGELMGRISKRRTRREAFALFSSPSFMLIRTGLVFQQRSTVEIVHTHTCNRNSPAHPLVAWHVHVIKESERETCNAERKTEREREKTRIQHSFEKRKNREREKKSTAHIDEVVCVRTVLIVSTFVL